MVVHFVAAVQRNIGESSRAVDSNAFNSGLGRRMQGFRWITCSHLNWLQILKIKLLLVRQYGAITLLLLLFFKNVHSVTGATREDQRFVVWSLGFVLFTRLLTLKNWVLNDTYRLSFVASPIRQPNRAPEWSKFDPIYPLCFILLRLFLLYLTIRRCIAIILTYNIETARILTIPHTRQPWSSFRGPSG